MENECEKWIVEQAYKPGMCAEEYLDSTSRPKKRSIPDSGPCAPNRRLKTQKLTFKA